MTIDKIDWTVVTQEPAEAAGQETVRTHRRRITPLAFFFPGLFAFALLAVPSFIAPSPAAAATVIAPTTTCGLGLGDLGGRGLICEVTIVNTITAGGGSATVTVHECLGSAGAPTDGSGGGGFSCSTKTIVLSEPVTAVTQCNNSINGGGGTLRCSVLVTNNFYGVSPGATAASVNQCVGSGGGITTGCSPFPATTTSAAITQCNGSANGGTLVQMTCTAAGTMASALAFAVNQCNGSANGGGSLVICSASLVNKALSAATPSPTATGSATSSPTATGSATSSPTASGSATPGRTTTPPPTSTVSNGSSNDSTPPLFALLILLVSGGLGLAVVEAERRRVRS
jgi:hypothetical protein